MAYYIGSQKWFSSKMVFFFTFKDTLILQKVKNSFWFKVFLQHKAQELDENIFNSHWKHATFLIGSIFSSRWKQGTT
jgi:hypothetical protein